MSRSDDSDNSNVAEFFDRYADYYHATRYGEMYHYHMITAGRIEASLGGNVLSIGGLWAEADIDSITKRCKVTVLDISEEMLKPYQGANVELVVGNALNPDFETDSFDHVVLPLVLHHLAGSSGYSARRNVQRVLAEIRSILKPGGNIWISDFLVGPLIYGLEVAVAPLTRRVLGLVRIPLVVMHSHNFYESSLLKSGYASIDVEEIKAPAAKAGDWIQPVIGLSWLKIPRILYPVKPALIMAVNEK